MEISKRVNELAGIKVPIYNNMLMPLAFNANMKKDEVSGRCRSKTFISRNLTLDLLLLLCGI